MNTQEAYQQLLCLCRDYLDDKIWYLEEWEKELQSCVDTIDKDREIEFDLNKPRNY